MKVQGNWDKGVNCIFHSGNIFSAGMIESRAMQCNFFDHNPKLLRDISFQNKMPKKVSHLCHFTPLDCWFEEAAASAHNLINIHMCVLVTAFQYHSAQKFI